MNMSQKTLAIEERELHWWNGAQLSSLAAHLASARARWQRAWIDDLPAFPVDEEDVYCILAHEYASGVSSRFPMKAAFEYQSGSRSAGLSQDACRFWVSGTADMDDVLSSVLLGMSPLIESSGRKSKNFADLAAAAFEDFLCEIKIVLAPHADSANEGIYLDASNIEMPAEYHRPWSGCICVSFPLYRDLCLVLHISPGLAASLLTDDVKNMPDRKQNQNPAMLASLQDALHDQPVNFRVELSPVELSLGHLQSLAIGNVLLLPHPLTQALEVKDGFGATLCAAYLGQSGGNRAIELFHPSPAKDGAFSLNEYHRNHNE